MVLSVPDPLEILAQELGEDTPACGHALGWFLPVLAGQGND